MPVFDAAARDEALIDKIGKLLATAASLPPGPEKDTFESNAMRLLADNNLDMASVELGGSGAKAAKRADEKLKGGLYTYQRDLVEAVAALNFCMYFHVRVYDHDKISAYWARKYGGKANVPEDLRGGFSFAHQLVGRTVNIAGTTAMVQYLEGAIERLVREKWESQPNLWFSADAVAFREGAVDEIRTKLRRRLREIEKAQARRSGGTQARGRDSAREDGGVSLENQLTLSDVKTSEEAGNYDFLYGEGSWARVQARRVEWAEERKREREEYTAWAEANPEEARKQEEDRRKASRSRTSWNAGTGETARDRRQNKGSYWRGREAGEKIGIEPQMDRGIRGHLK